MSSVNLILRICTCLGSPASVLSHSFLSYSRWYVSGWRIAASVFWKALFSELLARRELKTVKESHKIWKITWWIVFCCPFPSYSKNRLSGFLDVLCYRARIQASSCSQFQRCRSLCLSSSINLDMFLDFFLAVGALNNIPHWVHHY